jgi:uncharacterized protein YjeT (DUF2065 family)
MWQDLLTALALLLVLEGVLPFINPAGLRRSLQMISQLEDSMLRFIGLSVMILGCILLYVVR